MEKSKLGRLANKAKGLVLGLLNNPSTYLFLGAWIFLSSLWDRCIHEHRFAKVMANLADWQAWQDATGFSKEALVLFGGMFAICRIAKAIETGKASAGTPPHSSEKPE